MGHATNNKHIRGENTGEEQSDGVFVSVSDEENSVAEPSLDDECDVSQGVASSSSISSDIKKQILQMAELVVSSSVKYQD